MDCGFCGHKISPGVMDCPRCGGPAVPAGAPQPAAASSSPVAAPGGQELFTSAPTGEDLDAAAEAPVPAHDGSDPEAGLHTQLVSGDRQEVLETRIVEPPPVKAEEAPTAPAGLPDSRVARGVEDSLLGIRRFILRLGKIGRLAFFSHCVVIVGAVCPWYYVPHDGYTPGIERWGWLPLVLALAGIGSLMWRFRNIPKARILPVLIHLIVTAAIVLSLLWVYKTNTEMPDHLRPHLAPGIYISALGALGAALGSLIGLKDVR